MPSIELKPCPFCGREAVLSSIHIGGGDYRALVTCTRIGLSDGCASVMVERSSKKTAELDAVKKWNTRAERTCKNVNEEWEKTSFAHAATSFCCSECGAHYVDCESYYAALAGADEEQIRTNYCPNCGAKVVE